MGSSCGGQSARFLTRVSCTDTHETVDTGVDNGDLNLHGQGLVLTLLCRRCKEEAKYFSTTQTRTQELSQTSTTGQQEASGGIEIGTELGEGSNLTVLGEVELERTSELLHDLTARTFNEYSGEMLHTTYVWAAEPTRDTERPTLMAGRTPRKKSSASKKI